MSNIDINRVLADMRTLASEATRKPAGDDALNDAGKADFGEMLRDSIDQVNATQKAAAAATASFERGDPDVDLTEVMLSLQKADISFKAMTEVRNKLVEAYREIMNMPI